MKQKKKITKGRAKRSALRAKLPPPPIPPHARMEFGEVALMGEAASPHFSSPPESEGSIMLRQVMQRGQPRWKNVAKAAAFSILCGIVAGTIAFYALLALGIAGFSLYAGAFVAFAISTVVAFGGSGAC